MKRLSHFKLVIILSLALAGCSSEVIEEPVIRTLIPQPVERLNGQGAFDIKPNVTINLMGGNEELMNIGNYFADIISPITGPRNVISADSGVKNGAFNFQLSDQLSALGPEGYHLLVKQEKVLLEAFQPAGLVRGIQTIRQLLPPEIEGENTEFTKWQLGVTEITDYPNFVHRGAMLDVSRHFFGVEQVKTYIDWLARYKMNTLHLHLSDDQGWRIEIKKWPQLTSIGGSTQVGGGQGGYFTQEQYKDIVAYAQSRYITIIPEIDMPGHTNAALASYKELNCDNQAKELYTGIDVGFSSLCTRKEQTYEFIKDVVTEIAAMTPGQYIHIGGDESHSTSKEDYIYFITKTQDILSEAGKQMIGWDEVASIQLNSGSVAQIWNSEKNAKEAVRKGSKIILSPAKRAYLDMKYDSTTTLGLNWAGYINVKTGYDWSPENYFAEVPKKAILGVECPLWTETVIDANDMEYLVFPRLLGYSEIGWSPKEVRDWEDYRGRLANQAPYLNRMKVNFYKSPAIDWQE